MPLIGIDHFARCDRPLLHGIPKIKIVHPLADVGDVLAGANQRSQIDPIGREIDLRQFALEGMKLQGRLQSINGSTLMFCDDLKQNLDKADTVAESCRPTIRDGQIK